MAEECYAYVETSSVAGSGLFASTKIGPGELVFTRTRPLVAVVDGNRFEDTCSNCFAWTAQSAIGSRGDALQGVAVRACTGCKVLRYCSKKCQSESWKRNHKYECKLLATTIRRGKLPNAVRATIEILQRLERGALTKGESEDISRLESHIDDIKSSGSDLWKEIELMSMGAWSFSGTQKTFSREFAQGVFARVLNNCLTLVTPTYDPVGICLDPFVASANHSCDPNAVVVFDGPILSFRSLRQIEKDEEVFIAYVDVTNPFRRRQQELKERYHFTCTCIKCEQGATLQEDQWLQHPSKLDKKWDRSEDGYSYQNHPEAFRPENYVGPDVHSRRLAALQGIAFTKLNDAKRESDSSKAAKRLESAMRLCHETKMWPYHRQPYSSLRQQLFVKMLCVGNFTTAFVHALKTAIYVDPLLFPERFHPVRVVHNWTLAMLCIYLSSIPEDSGVHEYIRAYGLDFGLVIYSLLVEVASHVKQSHGESSTFARMVKRKLDEVTVDMTRTGSIATMIKERKLKIDEQWTSLKRIADSAEY